MYSVMLATTDKEFAAPACEHLRDDGFNPILALTLRHAVSRLAEADALVVGVGADNAALIQMVRNGEAGNPHMPIIALLSECSVFLPIRLLDLGADDVIVDPWLYVDIRARLAAIRRRMERPQTVTQVGTLRVDVLARRVWVAGREVKLPAKEFDLLAVLASEPHRVFTRAELLAKVWGLGAYARTRTLDQHAVRLRQRLSIGSECFVRNVWGQGYALSVHTLDDRAELALLRAAAEQTLEPARR